MSAHGMEKETMTFQQLFDDATYTFTYLLADKTAGEAVIIDPVLERVDEYLALLDEHHLKLAYVLDTHVHADHVTGAGALRRKTGCNTGLSVHAGVGYADLMLREGAEIRAGDIVVHVLETPGHTPTCLSYVIDGMVFTGDALLIGKCGRTDFQGGDAGRLYDSITNKLFALPDDTIVYPGHDYEGRTHSTIGEEKKHNSRLRLDREAFIRFMNELKLPRPRRIDGAVSANRACGERQAA